MTGHYKTFTAPSNDGQYTVCGLSFALERYKRYEGSVIWEHHSEYFGHQIERAYHQDGRPCALYRIMVKDAAFGECVYLTEVNLSGIKKLFKQTAVKEVDQ